MLADHRGQGFKRWVLKKPWRQHPVQTLGWRLYPTAGTLVRHAGRMRNKVRDNVIALFTPIRTACWLLAHDGAT